MFKKSLLLASFALLACSIAATAWAQDYERTYTLSPGGTISVSNVSGDISVVGHTGSNIHVTAYREGRDKDMVEIEDQSTADSIVLRARYPRDGGRYDASVRFVLQVPRGSHYRFDSITTVSGDVSITDVAGEIDAKSVSGDVEVKQCEGGIHAATVSGDVTVLNSVGGVTARSVSGDLEVAIADTEGARELSFTTTSGDVAVRVPAQLDADVQLSTFSGSLATDFPLTVEERENHGKKAFGILGSGAVRLKATSLSGSVRLVR